MTEGGEGAPMSRKRPRTVYCATEERAAIRVRAAAAGKPVSRLALDLALAGADNGCGPALTAEETRELLDGLRALIAFVRSLNGGMPPGGGSGGHGPPGAGEVADSGRSVARQARLSISATDEEWVAVEAQARRRGLTISHHIVRLMLPDGVPAGPHAGPLPALSAPEQREALDAMRYMRSLLSGADDAVLRDMRERLAAPFGGEAPALAVPGDAGEEESRTAPEEPGDRPEMPASAAPERRTAAERRETSPSPTMMENPERSDAAAAVPDPQAPQQGALF